MIYMNIVEAYKKFKGHLVILISGLPSCGKTDLAKNISRDFKIKLLRETDYYKKDYNNIVTLPNGEKVINFHTDDAIDWDRLNEDLDKYQADGVVIIGSSFPEDKIKVPVDFHIHLSISKKTCLDRRKEYLEKHKDEYPEEYKQIDTPTEKLKMNQLIFPYYLETVKKMKVNKFINIESLTDEKLYDVVFDYLVSSIEEYLYKGRKKEQLRPNKNRPVAKTTNTEESNTTDACDTEQANDEDDDGVADGPIAFVPIDEDQ